MHRRQLFALAPFVTVAATFGMALVTATATVTITALVPSTAFAQAKEIKIADRKSVV